MKSTKLKRLQRNTQITFSPINQSPPPADCAEVSLFGPGIGECIVLHFGGGRWFIIDSCSEPGTKKTPIALKYLESLGVNVATQVTGILITHWHSDHISGSAQLFKACSSSKIYLSSALTKEEALELAGLYKNQMFTPLSEDIGEFAEIIQYIVDKRSNDRLVPVTAQYTFFDERPRFNTRLLALSPSPAAITQATANIINITPTEESHRVRNVVPNTPNDNAVAIHFSFGDFSCILGSDLEESGNPLTGWSAILKSTMINDLNLPKSTLFKVAHHGSENGHHDGIWTSLLSPLPISITTPFSRSGLPTQDCINRIKPLSSVFIVTRDPNAGKKPRRDNVVEKEMNAVAKFRRVINDKMGHIQIRTCLDGDFTVAANSNCISFKKL